MSKQTAPYRYDYTAFWLVLEANTIVDHPNGAGWRIHSFPAREEAAAFRDADPNVRAGPFPLARTPLELAAPLLYAVLAAVRDRVEWAESFHDGHGQPAFDPANPILPALSAALTMAELDQHLIEIFRDTKKAILYDNRTPPDDPRVAPEAALRPFLTERTKPR